VDGPEANPKKKRGGSAGPKNGKGTPQRGKLHVQTQRLWKNFLGPHRTSAIIAENPTKRGECSNGENAVKRDSTTMKRQESEKKTELRKGFMAVQPRHLCRVLSGSEGGDGGSEFDWQAASKREEETRIIENPGGLRSLYETTHGVDLFEATSK